MSTLWDSVGRRLQHHRRCIRRDINLAPDNAAESTGQADRSAVDRVLETMRPHQQMLCRVAVNQTRLARPTKMELFVKALRQTSGNGASALLLGK